MARKARIAMVALPALAALALAAAASSVYRSNAQPAQVEATPPPAAREGASAASARVAGLGAVEPNGREVAVAAPVGGVVREVRAASGDRVRRGDALFTIDDRIAEATVEQRRRDLAIAQTRLAQTAARVPLLRADVEAASAGLAAAVAERDEAQDQVRAGNQLVGGAAIAERELARRRNALRAAEARVAEARTRIERAEADLQLIDPARGGASLRVDEATVAQARAALALAEAERERLVVRAPRDGTVLTVNVRAGEFAAQGAQTAPVTLGLLEPLHVRVDVDEADIPRFRAGAPAFAARRGAIGERIPLRFLRAEPVVQPKRNLSGGPDERVDTRVLQVLYEVAADEAGLKPGQALDVVIEVGPAIAARR
jgi:multidrug efflux pump subunit AcrA (membrane-fusion protein)